MKKARKPRPQMRHLSILLLKQNLKRLDDALSQEVDNHPVDFADGTSGRLLVRRAIPIPPKWVRFFDDNVVASKLNRLRNSSTAALLVVPASGRQLALSFGPGRFLLKPGSDEDDFGLKVTLNSIPADQVKSVDRKTFDAFTTHTRAQGSRAGTCQDYGVDVEQDLLRAVVGTPSDPSLGVNMAGVDSLSVGVKTSLDDIPALLGRYVQQFKSTGYKREFAWVDHIREERDRSRIDGLDQKLVDKLRASDFDRMWLAAPDLIDWPRVAGFRYGRSKKAQVHLDTRLADFVATVRDLSKVNVDFLKSRPVLCLSAEDENQLYDHWSVYQCLYAEIDDGDTTYLLTAGRWYRIARDFVTEVNADVGRLVVAGALPPFDSARFPREEDYNKHVAATATGFVLMDQRFIHHGGGNSKFELCDLMASDKKLIHVKRYAGSATLSHLFNQGEVTATLLTQDPVFRQKAIAKIPKASRSLVPAKTFRARAFTVVYAITSKSKKDIASSLPFFSRLALRRTARILTGHGYKVELTKIEDVTPSTP